MKDISRDIKKIFKKNKIEAESSVKDNFIELKRFLSKLDPIKLLSQLTLTFMFVPEKEIVEDNKNLNKWARWIEFLSGYLLAQPYNTNLEKNIDGRHIEKIEKILDRYFNSITSWIIFSNSKEDINVDVERIIKDAKISSLYIRGEAYPHQFINLAEELYSQHDTWFKNNLGFTIKEAINIYKAIRKEFVKRDKEEADKSKGKATEWANEQIITGKYPEKNRKELETKAWCYLFYCNSDKLLSFTLEELSDFSKTPIKICKNFLKRLSQVFGYRNPNFKNTFQNPFSAPWDYNTLYERPIIFYDDKYFIPLPAIFPTVLFNSFHYDLWNDENYREKYNKERGRWLEKRTAAAFEKIFPKDKIIINSKYPNGEEIADVLVFHDRKIFIVQCKSKKLTFEAKIGKDFSKLKDDLKKSIIDSFNQAIKAREYLNKNYSPKILASINRNITIDMKQVSEVFLVSVTLGQYSNITTRLANINPSLKLFSENEYPWAISIHDLEVITELIDSPSIFIHYATNRLQIEQLNFELHADEIDLLNFYFDQKLKFNREEFKKATGVCISGYSGDIDKYMIEKYELSKDVKKPELKIPQNLKIFINEIEKLDFSYRTDCIMKLLDLSFQDQENLLKVIKYTKKWTKKDKKLHSFFMPIEKNDLGITFISMNAKGDLNKLYMQVEGFSAMKKYVTKFKEWVGLGWDVSTDKKIDTGFFASFDWHADPVLEKLCQKGLKKGEFKNFNKIK